MTSLRTRLLFFALSASQLAACATAPRAATAPPSADLNHFLSNGGYARVPLARNAAGHLTVRAQINGITGLFIVDTGASGTVIEETRRAKFGLSADGAPQPIGAGAGASDLLVTASKADHLEVGAFRLRGFRVTLVSLSHVNDTFRQKGIEQVDGVLGVDLLDAGQAVIDYKNRAVFLKASPAAATAPAPTQG